MPEVYDFPKGFAGGMNISVSPDQINTNQSPNMINCSYDDGGVPSKRFGFSKLTEITLGSNPIQGMTEFSDVFLMVSGGAIFKKNEV